MALKPLNNPGEHVLLSRDTGGNTKKNETKTKIKKTLSTDIYNISIIKISLFILKNTVTTKLSLFKRILHKKK